LFLFIAFPLQAFAKLEIQLVVLPTISACQTLENVFRDLTQRYGSQIDVKIFFFVSEDPQGHYYSDRGNADFQELLRQAAIRERWSGQLWSYLSCRNSEMFNPIWEHSAEWAGIPPKALDAWVKSRKPEEWLVRDREIVKRLNLQKVPAVIINGELAYEGEVGLPEMDFAIQRLLSGNKKAGKYSAVIYHDPQSVQPQLMQTKSYLKKYVVGVDFELRPITSEKARDMAANKITVLPAVFMDGSFNRSYYFNYLTDESTKSFHGLSYIHTPIFVDTLLAREKTPGHMRVIMQAHCPASVSLLHQLMEKSRRKEITITLDYPYLLYEPITSKTEEKKGKALQKLGTKSGYFALHGAREMDETERQLIIQKNSPEKYWEYLKALYSMGLDSWEEALENAGIQKQDVEASIRKESAACLMEHYDMVKGIPATQSPVLLVDNCYLVPDIVRYFGGEIKIEGSCGVSR